MISPLWSFIAGLLIAAVVRVWVSSEDIPDTDKPMSELRLECLRMALSRSPSNSSVTLRPEPVADVIAAAQALYDFVTDALPAGEPTKTVEEGSN